MRLRLSRWTIRSIRSPVSSHADDFAAGPRHTLRGAVPVTPSPPSPPNVYRASESIAPLPGDDGLVSDSCSSSPIFASGFLPTMPRDSAVALGSWFRTLQPTGDFHLIIHTPCPAHRTRAVPLRKPPLKMCQMLIFRSIDQSDAVDFG